MPEWFVRGIAVYRGFGRVHSREVEEFMLITEAPGRSASDWECHTSRPRLGSNPFILYFYV